MFEIALDYNLDETQINNDLTSFRTNQECNINVNSDLTRMCTQRISFLSLDNKLCEIIKLKSLEVEAVVAGWSPYCF